MGPRAKREYLAQMRDRYVRAQTPRARGALLTEAMTVTGYHRKALIRAWGRRCHNTPVTVRALKALWTAAGFPWSVRLKALRTISARQIDRVLAPDKRRHRRRQNGGTRLSTPPLCSGKARRNPDSRRD